MHDERQSEKLDAIYGALLGISHALSKLANNFVFSPAGTGQIVTILPLEPELDGSRNAPERGSRI